MSEIHAGPPTAPPAARIRLPVWRLFAASFASVFSHPVDFIARAWLWIALAAAAVLGFSYADLVLSGWLELAVLLIATVGGLWFAFGWHRGLLLHERADWRGGLRFDLAFGRFVFVAVMVAFWYALVHFLFHLVATASFRAPVDGTTLQKTAWLAALTVLPMILALPVGVRLMLGFPFAAIRSEPHAVSLGWAAARGNVWRLCVLFVGTQLVVQIIATGAVAAITSVLISFGLQPLIAPAIKMAMPVFVFLAAAIGASLASYSYAVLTGHPLAKEVLPQS